MHSKIVHVAATAALTYLIALQPSQATVMLDKARVSQVINDVKKIDPTKGAKPAVVNETVTSDNAVRTGIQSRSELVFPDNTVTRLGANTEFKFTGGTRDMRLETGTLLLQVPKNAGGAKITTAAITAAITGTTVMWETIRPTRRIPVGKQLVKFIVLEGTARLYLNNRPFESIIVHAGQMVILPVQPRSLKDVEPVSVYVERLVQTSGLIHDLLIDRKITPFSLGLVDETIASQDQQFQTGKLKETNLVIPGSGTDVILATNTNTTANPQTNQTSSPTTPPPQVPVYPSTFTIDNTTQIVTDPSIQTGAISHTGGIYRSAALDGSLSSFLGGTSSPFLANFIDSKAANGPYAVFEFNGLTAADAPASVDNSGGLGPSKVILASIGDVNITSGGGGPGSGFRPYFDSVSISLLSLQGSVNTAPSMGINDNLNPGESPLSLSLNAALDVNLNDDSTFLISSAVAGRDINIGNSTTLECFDSDGALAGRNINIGTFSDLVISGLGGVSAGSNITLGDNSTAITSFGIIFTGYATDSLVSTVFAGGNIEIGSGGVIVRDVDGAGNGGELDIKSANGTINLNNAFISTGVTPPSPSPTPGPSPTQAGHIKIHSEAIAGVAINITNSSQLFALINNPAPTHAPGQIEVISEGGDVNISNSSVTTDFLSGSVDVHNNGPNGMVIIDGAELVGDVVKAGALGANGTLTITNQSTLSANTALQLYGGTSNGTVLFTGGGNIEVTGSQINIAAYKVQIDNGTSVQNNGATDIYATTHNYNAPALPVNSFGNFVNPVTQHPVSAASAY